MNKKALLLCSLLPISSAMANTFSFSEDLIPSSRFGWSDILSVIQPTTSTYVRCWYRTGASHDEAGSDWVWAKDTNGKDYKINGYWWSPFTAKNMFYTETPQQEIKQRCEQTIGTNNPNADILYYASDYGVSLNHTIWTNDKVVRKGINRIVAFGDSLSDTGNMFNATQWRFPDPSSWYAGHFSNGLVWTEYLGNNQQLPVYNWAVGGAAGSNQYALLTGVKDQIKSYLTYMESAKHHDPDNTLYTFIFGLNDFMNYNRSVEDVKSDFSDALNNLTQFGAKNLLLLTLPDATYAPQFKYSSDDEIEKVRAKIIAFNQYIREQVKQRQTSGINIQLYDAYTLFNSMINSPQQHGFVNAKDACLDINRSSAFDYLKSHNLTNDCAQYGSDKYVFWGVTHPTTAAHSYISDQIMMEMLGYYPF
ncbi:SGNH/GDSL hydrolase family protein [Vibrio sp. NTOU-M3]|uniref:SGNH/GDSL hydrolase family protein n=1 Tax=Vibrio sp. NTOU-M3 TaxID=3234954 RepID=UPI00349F07AF